MTKRNKNKENGDSKSPTELSDLKDERMKAVENGKSSGKSSGFSKYAERC